MNIGQASNASGVSAKMIRYYEEIGLVPKAARRDSGYRDYSESDVHRLAFIRRARDLGFTVDEISHLLSLWSDRSRESASVKALALKHVEDLRQKRIEIESMIATLEELARSCHGDHRPDCPIIEGLAASTVAAPPPETKKTLRRFGRPGELSARAKDRTGGATT